MPSSTHTLRWQPFALASVVLVLAGLGILAIRPAFRAHTPAPDPPRLAIVDPGAGDRQHLPTGSCGPSRWTGGVPLGWAPSREGAVAAAAGYAKTMSALWFLTDQGRRHQAIRLLATPARTASMIASQDRLAHQLGVLLGGGSGGPGNDAVLTTALLGYRVDSFTGGSARIALWAVVVHGSEVGASLAPAWSTSTLDLEWVGGDWKLAGATTAPGPGPVPQPDAGLVGSPASLITAARTFREFADVPA